MKATQQLHDLGQSLWLDNITRTLLDDGTLARYIAEDSVTGLTSNPSIFDAAIGGGDAYDAGIHAKALAGLSGEKLFTELALEDLRRAADLFQPIFKSTHKRRRLGLDGSLAAAGRRYGRLDRGGQADPRAGTARQPVRENSRYARRHSGDRGSDLPRAFRST
jgi:hypothetical protein